MQTESSFQTIFWWYKIKMALQKSKNFEAYLSMLRNVCLLKAKYKAKHK